MYEIRCIVGDRKLREVLLFLVRNNTLEPPVVVPVDDSVEPSYSHLGATIPEHRLLPALASRLLPPKKPKKTPIQRGSRNLKGLGSTKIVRDFIERSGAVNLLAREASHLCEEAGYSKGAYSHALKLLLADKTIKHGKKAGEYVVVRPSHANQENVQHG